MPGNPLDVRVDHISIAVPRIEPALGFFRRHFPIRIGVERLPGYSGDFSWADFYIGPFKIELIEPAGRDGFVDRFLARRGPGLHHWSFHGHHLLAGLERMERDGLRIVDRFESPSGEITAFVSPRSAFGVLVQFWQVPEVLPEHSGGDAEYRLRSGRTVRLRVDHISIAVRDIDRALRFFERYFPFRLRREPHEGWDRSFRIASFYIHDHKVELIQAVPGESGFVQRFIERRGEGFHHLSIDVDSLDPYLAELEADGLRVVDRQDLRSGHKTAFISPRSAYGVLIQLWESPEPRS